MSAHVHMCGGAVE